MLVILFHLFESNRRSYRDMVFFISNEGRSILFTHVSR